MVTRCANHTVRLLDLTGPSPQRPRRRGWPFVAEVTLDPRAYTGDLAGSPPARRPPRALHSAFGQGIGVGRVHLTHPVDGALPSDMALTSRPGR